MKKFTKTVLLRRNNKTQGFRVHNEEDSEEREAEAEALSKVPTAESEQETEPVRVERTLEDELFDLNTARIKDPSIQELIEKTEDADNADQEADQKMFDRLSKLADTSPIASPIPRPIPADTTFNSKVTETTEDNRRARKKGYKSKKTSNPSLNTNSRGPYQVTLEFGPIEDFISRINLDKFAYFIKGVVIGFFTYLARSKYINSTYDGRLHLHSFGLGIALTTLIIMVQPYMMVYFDSWVLTMGRLGKHLVAWLVIGAVISYALNPRKPKKVKAESSNNSVLGDVISNADNDFIPVQYTVKHAPVPERKRRPPMPPPSQPPIVPQVQPTQTMQPMTPRSARVAPYGHTRDDSNSTQDELLRMTEQSQAIEKARYDVESSRREGPSYLPSNYHHYMDNANKTEKEKQKYNEFIADNRDLINLRKAVIFNE